MRVLQLFLSLILTATCFGQYLKPIRGMPFVNRTHRLARSLVYWGMFNEGSGKKVFDLSGNGLTGTLGGNAAWVPGKFGPVIAFAPGSDYVDLGQPNVGGDFSISIWAYSTGPSAYNGNDGYFLGDSTDPANLYFRRSLDRSSEIELGVGDISGFGIPSSVDTWHHYVIVHKASGDFYLYEDGILVGTGAGSNFTGLTSNLYLGNRQDLARDFDGKLDVPMIYNRDLSPSEIAELYRRPFGMMKQPNPLLYAGVVGAPPGVVVTPYYYRGILLFPLLPFSVILALYGICFIRGDKKCAA